MGPHCIRADGGLWIYGHIDGCEPCPCTDGDILGGHGTDHPVRTKGWPREEPAAMEEVRQ